MTNDNAYLKLKQKALEKYFSKMNDMQKQAVFCIKGPLLILAGAGSGKTTVLVNRIANMIYFGNAYNDPTKYAGTTPDDEKFLQDYADGKVFDSERLKEIVASDCVNPWNILAITFTNKAAGELKERLQNMLGEKGDGITAATFHSACVRILRREIDTLGYTNSFAIYDSDDQQRVIKACLADMDISDKMFPPRMVASEISRAKDTMKTPDEYIAESQSDYRRLTIGKIYKAYQSRLKTANALDFDDIICLTVKLFEEFPDVLSHYQNLYKYILVDEYQDTNMVQYKLVAMLSQKHKNLCVVGDDDQSIYKFRGATIENILSFEEQFENAKVIRLEQNYRSTQNILNCANELISNNQGRKGKNLWTASGEGEKVTVYKAATEQGEARFVAETILEDIKNGMKYNDHAVLYRMNAQSNSIERALVAGGIPYKIFGGVKFYDRKEVKDMLAYLSVINNPNDLLRLKRIINEPKRGIGSATIDTLEQIASDLGVSAIQIMRESDTLVPLVKKSKILKSLASFFDEMSEKSEKVPLDELLDAVLSKSGYASAMQALGDEGAARLENINELKTTMINYTKGAEEPSLSGFLEEVALYTDVDSLDENADNVFLMTMHAAKGLEFPVVFAVGMEENIFPSQRSTESIADIEEERRLAYVAVTRAKKKLYLTYSMERMIFGTTNYNRPSRFLKELPSENIEKREEKGISLTTSLPNNATTAVQSMSLQEQLALMKKKNSAQNAQPQTFSVGDKVKHNIFGEGVVLSATKMSNDTMLEVAFEKVGTKKIMANFAKIKKMG